IVIAGNHDSPDRLAFGSEVLAQGGLHVVGTLEGIRPVTVPCADGGPPVLIHPVPFLEPARALIELAEIDPQAAAEASPENLGAATSHDALYARLLPRVHAARPKKARSVLLGHLFCEGARTLPEGATERPLAVGGSDRVSPARFAGFDYVALGHLHVPQWVGTEGRIRYSGSIMPYTFAEAGTEKSVTLIELGADGSVSAEAIPLPQGRGLRVVEGVFADLVAGSAPGVHRNDYVMCRLLDEAPVLEAMTRLKEVYPNLLHIERPALSPREVTAEAIDPRQKPAPALFLEFFAEVTGQPLSAEEQALLDTVLAGLEASERETPAPPIAATVAPSRPVSPSETQPPAAAPPTPRVPVVKPESARGTAPAMRERTLFDVRPA
ncbi:MAG: exonuclease SbcCD subunit D, partial [Planctomycetota bacterium]